MNCNDYHELISAYTDDELSERDTKKLLHHLSQCRECTAVLNALTFQRERLALVRASYDGPTPASTFSQTVMARIAQESLPRVGFVRRFLDGITEELLLPFKRPALALPMVLLLITGTVAGFYLQSLPNNPQQQLLSVYEVAAAQPQPGQGDTTSPVAEEVDGRLFDHFADTSTETFAARPCLLEYASYTCTSNVEDY